MRESLAGSLVYAERLYWHRLDDRRSFIHRRSYTGLIGLKAFRNLFAPPFVIIVDDPDDYFTFPTAPDVICYHSSH